MNMRETQKESSTLRFGVISTGPRTKAAKLPAMKKIPVTGHALVAWLSRPNHPAPIQATGGFINLNAKSAQNADL